MIRISGWSRLFFFSEVLFSSPLLFSLSSFSLSLSLPFFFKYFHRLLIFIGTSTIVWQTNEEKICVHFHHFQKLATMVSIVNLFQYLFVLTRTCVRMSLSFIVLFCFFFVFSSSLLSNSIDKKFRKQWRISWYRYRRRSLRNLTDSTSSTSSKFSSSFITLSSSCSI